jgi:dihydroorotase
MASTSVAIQVPGPADFHVHLRQGNICELVTPHVRQGGFSLAYVMVESSAPGFPLNRNLIIIIKPNLTPPITNTEKALAYKATLESLEPGVQYLMTLYLSPELTPQEIRKAKEAGIVGH